VRAAAGSTSIRLSGELCNLICHQANVHLEASGLNPKWTFDHIFVTEWKHFPSDVPNVDTSLSEISASLLGGAATDADVFGRNAGSASRDEPKEWTFPFKRWLDEKRSGGRATIPVKAVAKLVAPKQLVKLH